MTSRVTRPHGNSGVVKSKFSSNLPPRAFGASVRITPDHGIALSTPPDVKAPIDDQSSAKPLGWYKTMIDMSSLSMRAWAELSDSWGTLSLGSLDVAVQAVTCSPSGLSSHGRCVLAVLNTNMEVTLWEGTKNHLRGEWNMIEHVTDHLVDTVTFNGTNHEEGVTRQEEVSHGLLNLISGYPLLCYWMPPSLQWEIEIGDMRSGGSRNWRGLSGSHRVLTNVRDASNSCIHVRTVLTDNETGTTILAYAMSDGGIGLLQVSQTLEAAVPLDAFVDDYNVERHVRVDVEQLREFAVPPDKRGITAMKWVDVPGRNPILVAKQSWDHSPLFPSSLPLPTYALANPLVRVKKSLDPDTTIVSRIVLFDSRFGVILRERSRCPPSLSRGWSQHPHYHLRPLRRWSSMKESRETGSTSGNTTTANMGSGNTPTVKDTTITRTSDMPITSGILTKVFPFLFRPRTPTYQPWRLKIDGFVPYDSCGTVAWIYEVSRPTDFSYKHEAKHSCVLLVTPFWSADDHWVMKMVEEKMDKTGNGMRCATRVAPVHLLRGIFLQLADTTRFERLCRALLNILDRDVQEDPSTAVIIPEWTKSYSEDIKIHLRKSLATHFFGWGSLLRIRMKLALADGCWKLCQDAEMRNECGRVACAQLAAISHRVLRILVRHLTAIVTTLSPVDVPYVLRVVVQSLLPGSPLDLSSEAQALSDKVNAMTAIEPGGIGLHEICPACRVEVPLQDITQATCLKGHTWTRCSVTSFILSTAMVRTCIGCNRKALLPPSQSSPDEGENDSWMPVAARSWVVKELLEAVDRCVWMDRSMDRGWLGERLSRRQ
ncbi:putative zinc-finger of transcription factor IIIC complex-domain-containing protein [Pisolithus orientalis]|uniref:putative zinc-finger of transcription factor IIIC complex-domain-containing protein n=1 Tax=Pisolithus orientalis TaxID=936130 RepID=UPI002225599F|nr:putative zinc-finger of transcription factor IIIC complex-domain-containing protein [Pisolithus orientalis]KAI6010951.1 putative zinc-finger of transcription factor IIIC complex-domain-containing protein [Pisolithus orientalis]